MTDTAREIAGSSREMLTSHKQKLTMTASQLQQSVTAKIQNEKTKIVRIFTSLDKDSRHLLRNEMTRIDRNAEGLRQGTRKILDLADSQFKLIELRVKNADPQTIVSKGYTLTLDKNGKFVRNASQLASGDILQTRFKDGTVESVVR